jgi:hypothetical protein
MSESTKDACEACQGNLWVADGEPDRAAVRTPGAGLVPCGTCNAGNWESPRPYPGWPGRCREYACDDATHPCALYHDPTACERRVPLDGCGCDLDGLVSAEVTTQIPAYIDIEDEAPWCENEFCHDRLHIDGLHTDENGRLFHGEVPDYSESEDWPADEPDEDLVDAAPAPAAPPAFPLTPIHDQLVAERTYPELT